MDPPQPPGAGRGPVGLFPSADAGGEQPAQQIRAIRLRLYTIEVPVGLASATEEIWSYLNEEAVGTRTHLALGLNGLRVGLGRRQDWPELSSVLQRLTGRKIKDGATQMLPGNAAKISLKRDQPVRTLFLYRADRTLTGQSYADGEYLLSVSCGLNPEDTSQVMFTAMPLLRTVVDVPQYVRHNGSISVVKGPQYVAFRDLLFQLSVPDDSFIVIGPGRESRRATSAGNCLLVNHRKGMPFETVLVLVPQAFSAQLIPDKIGR
jgi:hypothetical protein